MNKNLFDKTQSYYDPQQRMALLPNYYRWIYNKFQPYIKGRVVELGCGCGHFIQHYYPQVEQILAIDYDPLLLKNIKIRIPDQKVKVANIDLTEDWEEIINYAPDVVIALDVMEHFEDDTLFVNKVSRMLKLDGFFLVKVPAQKRLYSTIDRASGHYRRYEAKELTEIMAYNGFQQIKLSYINPIGALIYRLKRNKNTNFSRIFSLKTLHLINFIMLILPVLDNIFKVRGLSLVGVFKNSNAKYRHSRSYYT